jgi:hypothetical protein
MCALFAYHARVALNGKQNGVQGLNQVGGTIVLRGSSSFPFHGSVRDLFVFLSAVSVHYIV